MISCCLCCGYCDVHSGSFDMPFYLWAKYRNTETQQFPATVSQFVTDEFVMFCKFIIIVNTHLVRSVFGNINIIYKLNT